MKSIMDLGLGKFLCLLLLSTLSSLSAATEPTKPDASQFIAIRKESRDNADRIQQALSADSPNDSADVAVLREELNLWQQIELAAAQRETVAEAMQLASSGATATEVSAAEITSFMELEETRETLAVTRHNLSALENELVAERTLALETRELLEKAEQDHRRTTELLLTAEAESRSALQQQQRLDSLRIRLHRQQHDLHHDTIEEMEHRELRTRSILKNLHDGVELARPRVRLAKSEVNKELKRLGEIEDRVRSQLSMLDQRMRMHLSGADHQGRDDESNQLDVIREESQLLRQLLTEIVAIRECWDRRYEFSNQKIPTNQLRSWLEDALQAELRLKQICERLASRSSQRRQQMVAIQRRLSSEQGTDTDRADELAQLEAIVNSYGTLQEMAARGARFYTRFAEDLELRQSRFSLADSLAWCGSRIGDLWHFELTAVDDRSVTVGKLITALMLLVVGMLISARGASIVAFRILPRFGFNHAAATTIRQVMIYGLFAATTMLSLHMVNVPLTIFAFLGGAVAIGVGFGSQNTIANFISGLILLVQRPIRIGDLVNVDGINANVEQIGARATRVRTSENLEILIPNHNILNNNVTNWTLSDTRIRTSVSVGVAYGTPVRPVQEALKRVVVEHPKVIRESEPIVIFKDFGDSSLVFDVHFWIHMRTIMDRSVVRSDIRVAIDDAFRRAGIVIAFPQRDVHLDLESPLEIALIDARSAPQQTRGRAA